MNIIVTGASRGIGYETVRQLSVNPDHRIIALARSREKLEKLKIECGMAGKGEVLVIPFDLESGNYNHELLPSILKHFKNIDVLISNAGLLINKPFDQQEEVDFDRMFNSNVKSIFKLTQALLPFFSENAHIVNISSMGGVQGSEKFPGLSLYSASKGAVAVLTECLAEELKNRKISVNCLALGAAQTEMLAEAFPGYEAPLSASEMASFIADFSLYGHKWFNGKILPVAVSTP